MMLLVAASKVLSLTVFAYILPQLVFKPLWPTILNFFGSPINTFIIGQFVVHVAVYVVVNALFSLLYLGWFTPLQKYKVSNRAWPWECKDGRLRAEFISKVWKAIRLWVFNNVCLGLPLAYLTYREEPNGYGSVSLDSFPSTWTIAWQLLAFILIEDTLSYWAHRSLHTFPVLYEKVHKVHHSFKYTIALAAEYTHPVEWALANVIPFLAGPQLLGAHTVTLYMWMIYRISSTMELHSGYVFPFSLFSILPSSTIEHDMHHSMLTGNYGSAYGLWDWLCHTSLDVRFAVTDLLVKPEHAKHYSKIAEKKAD